MQQQLDAGLTKVRELYSQVGINIPLDAEVCAFSPENYSAAAEKRKQGIIAGYVYAGGNPEEIEKVLDEQIRNNIEEITYQNVSACVDKTILVNSSGRDEGDILEIAHEAFHVHQNIIRPEEAPEEVGKLMYKSKISKNEIEKTRLKDYLELAVREGGADVASIELLKIFGNDSEKKLAESAETGLKYLCEDFENTFSQLEKAENLCGNIPPGPLDITSRLHGVRFIYDSRKLNNDKTLFETCRKVFQHPPNSIYELNAPHNV